MVINDFNAGRAGGTLQPFEANPPLVVDADAMLALAVSLQSFQAIAGQRRKIPQDHSSLQTIQFQPRSPFNARKRLHALACGKVSGPLVPIARDHRFKTSARYALRQA